VTSKATKIRVGLFALVTGALIAIVLAVFGGIRFWERRDSYKIVFDGTVMGLEEGAQVYLNGVKVGTVSDIAVSPDDVRKVVVEIRVRHGTPVKQDTQAMLQFAGITGLKIIDLRRGSPTAPRLASGGTIPPGETVLDKLEEQATTLADRSTELITRANQALANITELTDPQKLDGLFEEARRAAKSFADASLAMRAMIDDNRVAMRRSIDSANRAVTEIQGVVRDNAGTLKGTLADMRQTSRSFKDLARELHQKPSRLLFSGSPPDRKLP
jgi:phospholipid/cholesterol/gamma-HCH transport system substrate-binding protein